MLIRALFFLGFFSAATCNSLGQTRPTNLKPDSEGARAFTFFTQIEERSFDEYLQRVRLPQVSPSFKAQVLAQSPKDGEVKVTERMRAKLTALAPILAYHERGSVIAVRVTGAKELSVALQGRAVLLISEPALYQLSEEELQATVAHELGHEYFWGELVEARQQNKNAMIREIELRCDGIAIITLRRLGLNPAKLSSALTRIRTQNARMVSSDRIYHPARGERDQFIRSMDELVQSKQSLQAVSK